MSKVHNAFSPADSRDVPFAITDDTDIVLLVKYIGSSASGTVTVAADGNITFKHGAVGAEANDTSVGGAADSGATIDVSETTEDTLGEVVDLINGSANWCAVIVDGLRDDTATDALLLMSASQAKIEGGLQLLADTDTRLVTRRLIAPDMMRKSIEPYLVQNDRLALTSKAPNYPFEGTRAEVSMLSGKSTYGSGTSTWEIHEEGFDPTTRAFVTNTIHSGAGGSTGAEDVELDGKQAPITSQRNFRLVAGLTNSAAMASLSVRGMGRLFRSLA